MGVEVCYKDEVHEWEVCPHDTVLQLQLLVHNRWGIEPAQQRVKVDGLPLPPTLRLGLLGEEAKFHVSSAKHGGGPENAGKRRKRGGKGSSVRAAKHRSKMRQTLLYEEVKEIMNARSNTNEEVSFREYEEEMADQECFLSTAKEAGFLAEKEYANKLEKLKVPIYGNLRMHGKASDSIRMMSINVNGMSMSKRGNCKADRLRQLISQYQLDAVGIQEVCVNWGQYKTLNRLAALLRRGYDPIRSVQSHNTLESSTNIGNSQRGGTSTVLQGIFSKFVKKTGKSTGMDHTGLGRWSWYTME